MELLKNTMIVPKPTYDLFISYADEDTAWVEGYLIDALEGTGVRIYSEKAFAVGQPRLLEFENAITHSQRTLLVLSPAYLAANFTLFVDVLAQFHGLSTASWPVIPLKLKDIQLPPRLAMLTCIDATDADQWPAVIEKLCADLGTPVPVSASKPPCPYPGMVPFQAREARLFHGRDDEIKKCFGTSNPKICSMSLWMR